jgi:hypothetical protein
MLLQPNLTVSLVSNVIFVLLELPLGSLHQFSYTGPRRKSLEQGARENEEITHVAYCWGEEMQT